MLTGKVKLFYPLDKSIGVPIPHALFTPIDRGARVILLLFLCKVIWTDYLKELIKISFLVETVNKIPFF